MSKKHTVIDVYLKDIHWIDMRFFQEWATRYDVPESKMFSNIIDNMWHDEPINWTHMPLIKKWLMGFDEITHGKLNTKFAGQVVAFIEKMQDRAVDTDEISYQEVYGWEAQQDEVERPNHMKLVVSNYFQPRERINQPPKPEPVLTLV